MDNLNKLYVGLDAILDLRLGVMNYLSAEFAYAVTSEESYFKREEDRFGSTKPAFEGQPQAWGNLAPEAYNRIMQEHPSEVIRGSIETRINKFVRVLCASHWQNTMREGQDLTIEIEVNVFPYQFDEGGLAALQRTLQAYFGTLLKVSLVYLPWERLTLEHVRNNYFGMVMYEFVAWANLYEVAMKKAPLRNTCLYVPRIYVSGKPSADNFKLYEERKIDPFEDFSRTLMPILPIQHLPVAFFCAATTHNLDVYTDPPR